VGTGLNTNSVRLSKTYATALAKHVSRGPRGSLKPAGLLGRKALTAGLGTTDLSKIHQQAVIGLVMTNGASAGRDEIVRRAWKFLREALAPIEIAGRTALLSGTQQRLAREIARREALQIALKKSERHYAHLLNQSHHMQDHLRRLSHGLLSAQEDERKRISRELHDEIGQTLTAINVQLATLRKEATIDSDALRGKIAATQLLLERSLNSVHSFARDLRPPLLYDLGLIPALHSFMKSFTKRTGVPVSFKASAAVEKLNSDARTVLYRVAQEAFTNIARHAKASAVKVSIQRVQSFARMEIHDNGKSFQVQRVVLAKKLTRLGLIGMRERVEMAGGRFTVDSAPRRGTTIRAEVPFGRAPGNRRSLEVTP
jgi:signal transduction histidine kinase